MSKKEKDLTWWTWVLIISALLLIVLSFIAPIVFTSNSSCFDFTNTGPIGDTIGGIMNPFIAIAGVIASFLAFYIQIRANKVQREQFGKAFRKQIEDTNNQREQFERELKQNEIEEQLECFYILTLLDIDTHNIIDTDIPRRQKSIKDFIAKNKAYPTQINPIGYLSTKIYDRVLGIDRISILKGFSFFLSRGTEVSWIRLFNELYPPLDYLRDSINEVYKKIEYHNKDIYSKLSSLREDIQSFDNLMFNEFKKESNKGTNSNYIRGYFDTWGAEKEASINEERQTNFNVLPDILDKIQDTEFDFDFKDKAYSIRREINNIYFQVASFNENTESIFFTQIDNALADLKDIIGKISTSISNISEDDIRAGKYLSSCQQKV